MNLPAPAHATNPTVFIHDGKAVTSSQNVASNFVKRHDNVIQKIKSLDCSPEFNALNFKEVDYIDAKGEKRPAYEMTKDGFIFLVMGFTGKKAAAFKEAYIGEFNRMEAELSGTSIRVSNRPTQEEIDAYNINCLLHHYKVVMEAWRHQIMPALRSLESPLAGRLASRFSDGMAFAQYVESSLNSKLLPGQRPRIQ
ncbi:Rha family transcriptional regulator [Budviciaceae bacterium CWB-B4]|uniref:Rha family transcriptional regulator n=1 Tax=Limnobaculum xujianqingii TaxID=2738837 RepID=A0A9D7AM86_9GAMM|nr:Rha family transcriptional regulator [Limnobaculum xujianqingii]MBK5075191.1 Rha family transcriptional regulator [Limnobaculum xujianqingii]MBK5178498.1 Rha family transcriptional regulator [Limnobaculum xujianqingii]